MLNTSYKLGIPSVPEKVIKLRLLNFGI